MVTKSEVCRQSKCDVQNSIITGVSPLLAANSSNLINASKNGFPFVITDIVIFYHQAEVGLNLKFVDVVADEWFF